MANTVIIWYNLYARLRERLQSGPAGGNVCLNHAERQKKAYMRLAAAPRLEIMRERGRKAAESEIPQGGEDEPN